MGRYHGERVEGFGAFVAPGIREVWEKVDVYGDKFYRTPTGAIMPRAQFAELPDGSIRPPIAGGADGLFYNDLREPFIASDQGAVTLAVTAKALYTASAFPVLGGQYFSRIGKKLRIRLFGRMTTGATPGNGSFNVYYGTGADANGVALMTGTPVALVANGTSLSWEAECFVHCRSTGSAGTLFCTGSAKFNVGLLLSTNAPMLLPASLPAVSAGCDLTAALIISVQFLRSGSTGESMQVHDMEVVAMN